MTNLENCNICPRKCNIDRSKSNGFCRADDKIHVSRVGLHMWEEPSISGERGSGTIFFTGCNLRCVFCQNRVISNSASAFSEAKILTAGQLCDEMLKIQELSAHNINLVTPTHYLPLIAEAIRLAKPKLKIPIVYNSSGYESVESLRELNGLVDIYLPDLKYFSSELSRKYSGAGDYFEVASRAIYEMFSQVGECVFENSESKDGEAALLKRGVVVRHLVLPGCRSDSIKLLEILSELLPVDKFKLSLMRQFTPDFVDRDKYPELARKITTFEYNSVVKRARELGFDGYVQSAESAVSAYTPSFNCPEAFI